MDNVVYEKLKEVAHSRQTTFYSDIAPLANLDMGNPRDRQLMGQLLGEISSFEHEHGRPLLSAIVVSIQEYSPGQGFFGLARDLGVFNHDDEDRYWVEERNRVWDHWSTSIG